MTVYHGEDWSIFASRWERCPPPMVDAVVSDPPYDERTHRNGRRGASKPLAEGGRYEVDLSICHEHIKGFDHLDQPGQLADSLLRLSRRWVVCFCTIEQVGAYAAGAGDERWIRGGVWVKRQPTPQFTGDRPGTFGDAIAIMHPPGRKRWNGGGRAARWVHSTASPWMGHGDDCRVHTTQKPLALMLDLVEAFTEPGETVWDPYCGSGTTGVACLRLGRRFIGHEMQPHYAEVAAERLRAEARGLNLSSARAGQTSILDALRSRG